MPISTHDLLKEECDALGVWVDDDVGIGVSSQATFDGKETFKFFAPAGAAETAARNYVVAATAGAVFNASIWVYHAVLGVVNSREFKLYIPNQLGNGRLGLAFATDGFHVETKAAGGAYSWAEYGTNLVKVGVWQQWTFQADVTNAAASTVTVWLNGGLVGRDIDCSINDGAMGEVHIRLSQDSSVATGCISYVDKLYIGTGLWLGSRSNQMGIKNSMGI